MSIFDDETLAKLRAMKNKMLGLDEKNVDSVIDKDEKTRRPLVKITHTYKVEKIIKGKRYEEDRIEEKVAMTERHKRRIEKYNKIDKNDLDIIRIKTKPCNDDSGDTAWYYLQEIFDGVTKYFEKLEEENGYALTFDNFLNEYNDKTVNRTRLEIGLETLFDSDSKNGLLKNICYLILKKILRLNEYSTDKFKQV